MKHSATPMMPLRTGETLPAVFADDYVVQTFAGAVDSLFAPMVAALDCLSAYLDPSLTPETWLRWLATWVTAESHMPTDQLRRSVAQSAAGVRFRGTRHALEREIAVVLGVTADVTENGAGAWSDSPDAALPGRAAPSLRVRVSADDQVDVDVLRAIVERHRPAHVPLHIEVVSADSRRGQQLAKRTHDDAAEDAGEDADEDERDAADEGEDEGAGPRSAGPQADGTT